MTSREDEWVRSMLEFLGDRYQTSPEHPYNHYGESGYVDLYAFSDEEAFVTEVKADAALRTATGANEIIRQFNKTKEYFYESERLPFSREGTVRFRLNFLPTEATVTHVRENFSMYEAAVSQVPTFGWDVDTFAEVRFVEVDKPHIGVDVLGHSTESGEFHRVDPANWGPVKWNETRTPDVHQRMYDLTKDW